MTPHCYTQKSHSHFQQPLQLQIYKLNFAFARVFETKKRENGKNGIEEARRLRWRGERVRKREGERIWGKREKHRGWGGERTEEKREREGRVGKMGKLDCEGRGTHQLFVCFDHIAETSAKQFKDHTE